MFKYSSPGKGVLVRQGPTYYYPAHIISWDTESKTGTVQMWRGIHDTTLANQIIRNVPVADVVDGLWQDQSGRRSIQVI